jgi:hypothetical protein
MTTRAPRLSLVVALHAALAVGYLGLLGRELASRERLVSSDFTAYDTGAALVAEGAAARLYDADAQADAQARLIAPHLFPGGLMAFLNPPHVALVLAPLARLDFATAFRLWTALQLGLVVLAARRVAALVARSSLERAAVFTSVGAFWPVFYALQLGQLSPLLLLAALELYAALAERRHARAGAWLFALAAKPQLLPLFPILLVYSGRVRALLWAGLFGALAFVVTGAALGFDVWGRYARGLVSLERFFAQGTPEHMTSLRGVLSLAFGARAAVTLASFAALFVVAVLVEARWRRRRLLGEEPSAFARRYALTAALALVFSPHLFAQDLALWIAPLAIFLSALDGERRAAFARFALAWPLGFVVVAAVHGATGRSAALAALALPVAALVLMARDREGAAS